MRTRRQNIQLELALEPVAKGEARNPDTQGTEARTTHAEPERPAAGQQPLMEAVVGSACQRCSTASSSRR